MAIPQKEYSQVQASGQFDTAQASIAMTPEMFELLSAGIYEDRPLAIVRELLCNGRDAMKEYAMLKGVPVESLPEMTVHIPNSFQPWFFVRDYGTGLTQEQVFDIYLSYGKSTKTGSNDFIGMFGIGSKSPLAYTDSFVVTSYIDGVETQYNVYKDSGIPKISKLIEKPTTEPNGLKVMVAIRQQDNHVFKAKVERFLEFFDFPVNVEGDIIEKRSKVSIKNDAYWLVTGFKAGAYALMGGVVYQLNHDIYCSLRGFMQAETIIFPFEIGSLNIASSRENLSFVDGDATDVKIKERVKEVEEEFFKDLQETLDTKTTLHDVWVLIKDVLGLAHINDYSTSKTKALTHGGTSLSDLYKSYHNSDIFVKTCWRKRYGRGKVSTNTQRLTYAINIHNELDTQEWQIWRSDRATGNIKGLREYVMKYTDKKIFVDPDEAFMLALEEVYGSDKVAELKVVKCSEVYDELCPKSTVTRRKVSGVEKITLGRFGDVSRQEVTELDGTETGVQFVAHRNDIRIEDEEGNFEYFGIGFLTNLIEKGLTDAVYLVRNSAPKRNRPNVPMYYNGMFAEKLKGFVKSSEIRDAALWRSVKDNLTPLSYSHNRELHEFYLETRFKGVDLSKVKEYTNKAEVKNAYNELDSKLDFLQGIDQTLAKSLRAKLDQKIRHTSKRMAGFTSRTFLAEYPVVNAVEMLNYMFDSSGLEQLKELVKRDIVNKYEKALTEAE